MKSLKKNIVVPKKKDNSYVYFMILGIIVLLVGAVVIYVEIHNARAFCKSVQGKPSLTGRKCNGVALVKYSDGWDFERPTSSNFSLNLSGIP